MSATFLFSFVIVYFLLLLGVAWYTSRNSNNDSFFIGNRNSNWMLVSFGMIGTSLSGVTFVSVPGTVGANSFGYFQVVIGCITGYILLLFIIICCSVLEILLTKRVQCFLFFQECLALLQDCIL